MAFKSLQAILDNNDQVKLDKNLSATLSKKKTPAQRVLSSAKRTALENKFLGLWRQVGGDPDFWVKAYIEGYEGYEAEYELDFYNADTRLAIEVQGGQYMAKSGHSNPKGLGRDGRKLLKCNELEIDLLHLPTEMVSGEWVLRILALAEARKKA
jgi:hypothetical protein